MNKDEQSVQDSMRLPPGLQCGDCFAFAHCKGLFGCEPTNTRCDWAPSRFRLQITDTVVKTVQENRNY